MAPDGPRGRPRLVLASGSSARRELLENAGIGFDVDPADVDEEAIRDSLLARDGGAAPGEIAMRLAEAKAAAVSARHPEALVIGADQVLEFEGRPLDKAPSMDAARAVLLALCGKTHALHSAVVLCGGGTTIWRGIDTARLTLRAFSEAALDDYLAKAGPRVLSSVGSYQIEGPAIQLFERIEGEHATILGMPLLPLIHALRREGALLA